MMYTGMCPDIQPVKYNDSRILAGIKSFAKESLPFIGMYIIEWWPWHLLIVISGVYGTIKLCS